MGSVAAVVGYRERPVGAGACVGVAGNEHADQQAAKGACTSLQQVTVHKAVTDIRGEVGLEEMPDEYSDSEVLGGAPGSLTMRWLMMTVMMMTVRSAQGGHLLLTGTLGGGGAQS